MAVWGARDWSDAARHQRGPRPRSPGPRPKDLDWTANVTNEGQGSDSHRGGIGARSSTAGPGGAGGGRLQRARNGRSRGRLATARGMVVLGFRECNRAVRLAGWLQLLVTPADIRLQFGKPRWTSSRGTSHRTGRAYRECRRPSRRRPAGPGGSRARVTAFARCLVYLARKPRPGSRAFNRLLCRHQKCR